MKYIIEIKPEYEGTTKGIIVLGIKNNCLCVDELAIEELEELNSDYINEHFGDLQDDAYNKGYAQCQDDYGDALKHAKDTAYKKGFEDGKAVNDKGCEGCKYEQGGLHDACNQCCNSYHNQWKASDDKIEVGDEVNWIGDCFIVTRIFQPRNMKEQCDGIDDDGCVYHDVLIKDLEKTGRHFDIDKILEEMKE